MRYAIAVMLVLMVAACGGGGGPAGQAASLLSQAGASASGPAYTVTSADTTSTCDVGTAEADGTISGEDPENVNVCVFPSNAQLQSDLGAGQFSEGSAIVEIGQVTLIFIDPAAGEPPASLVQSIASKTGGSVFSDDYDGSS
jgi:hypothetical protein